MDGKKIDITSGAIEKLIDGVSSFLSKLISPAADEFGLLVKGAVTNWRFKQQVRMLDKARTYCIKHNISPKSISPKLLVPLLENASLEDDEFLLDKWATMLGNMVDSEQNIKNIVFPFILSQISKEEYVGLETDLKRREEKYESIRKQIKDEQEKNGIQSNRIIQGLKESAEFVKFVSEHSKLQQIEIANLVRCGLLATIPIQSGYSRGVKVDPNEGYTREIEIDVEHVEDKYVITELGELFIQVCSEKINRPNK